MDDARESARDRKLQEIARELNGLEDENRNARLRALRQILHSTIKADPPLDSYILHESLRKLYKPVLRKFSDPVEICRELSVELICKFWEMDPESTEIVQLLIPTLVQRLGQHDITETSEEIRLTLMKLTTDVVDRCRDKMGSYLDDLIKILRATIIDPYPEVKKESCKCASLLAKNIPRYFHQQSESLINPLMKTLTHQHAKVRVRCVETIGDVVQYGNNKSVDDVVAHLAQRLFDYSPQVRLTVSRVVGRWLVELPDRYSFFHRLIPILLTGFSDEVDENSRVTENLWFAAGAQFERENEEDLKDEMDFRKPAPVHYPPEVQRPNLGCRTLVARNFSKILPALINDMDDWVSNTRLKSAHLLYALLLNGEDNITQQLSHVISALCRVCREDQEENVLIQFTKAAELLGYFIKPKTYCPLILEHVKTCPTVANLVVLSAVVRGGYRDDLKRHLSRICDVISKREVCEDSRPFYQLQLLANVESIIRVMRRDVDPVSLELFRILLTVYALSTRDDVRIKADQLITDLAETRGLDKANDLFREHLGDILKTLEPTRDSWLPSSSERFIFEAILSRAGSSLGEHLDTIVSILKENLKTEKDAQMRLSLFICLCNLMHRTEKSDESADVFDKFALAIIREMILPNLTWHAGRSAGALRTAAMSCLWALFDGGKVTAELSPHLDELLTQLLTNLEDDVQKTRLLSCRVLTLLFELCSGRFDLMRLHDVYPHLLKRLDDASNEVRILSTKMFSRYLSAFGNEFAPHLYRAHLEDMFNGLLLHLDDPDPNVQEAVLDLLKDAAQLCPQLLQCQTQDARFSHRSTSYCDELLKHVEKLKIEN